MLIAEFMEMKVKQITNYYELLELDPHTSQEKVAKAIFEYQKKWQHRMNAPDLYRRQEAERMMALVPEIENILLNPYERAVYDEKLASYQRGNLETASPNKSYLVNSVAALIQAIEAAPEGSIVELAKGEYIFQDWIPIQKSITIKGQGMDATRIISKNGAFKVWLPSNECCFKDLSFLLEDPILSNTFISSDARKTEIRNCKFQAVGAGLGNGWGIMMQANGSIEGCVFLGLNTGLQITDSTNAIVKNNKFQGDTSGLFGILSIGCSGLLILENTFEGYPTGIMFGAKEGNGTIKNNFFTNNGHAMQILNETIIEDNECKANNRGISVLGDGNCIIRNNKIMQSKEDGIFVDDRGRVVLEDNYCLANYIGIEIISNANSELYRNGCSHNKLHGIILGGNSQITMSDNVCSNNENSGIIFTDQANGLVHLNACTKNFAGIGFIKESTGTIRDNWCFENQWGIAVQGNTNALVENNECTGNIEGGIRFKDAARGRVTGNKVSNNSVGIQIADQASSVIQGNDCSENSTHNILDLRN